MVNSLRGDDVRSFIDVMDEVRSTHSPPHEIRLTGVGTIMFCRLGPGCVRTFVKDQKEMYQIVVQGLPFSRGSSKIPGDPRLL